ncbi:Lrp/AsnC family transcriptional regulator [Rhodoferax ferrireducens]|uniref:Lrp/AsnC family transcriptional regulator n=1 Tax=Rhodoferax ferrireducens TaxID=192843 RepID=UPI003B3BB72B
MARRIAAAAVLAERVALSQSPCLARVKRLGEAGYIKSYVALLDTERTGLHVNIRLRLAEQGRDRAVRGSHQDHPRSHGTNATSQGTA